jgi:predicted RNase H-like HicB family nuclease
MGETMKQYAVIIESGPENYSAYSPDVPGCVATGETLEEVKENFQGALEFHIEGLRLAGLPVPEPTTLTDFVSVAA